MLTETEQVVLKAAARTATEKPSGSVPEVRDQLQLQGHTEVNVPFVLLLLRDLGLISTPVETEENFTFELTPAGYLTASKL